MEPILLAWVSGLVLGVVPLLLQLIWYWNELLFVGLPRLIDPAKTTDDGSQLPPGHMGLPFLGETLRFLWYFKILRRPDDFIHSKRERYGEGVGMYRTHLFGSPAIITCSPASNKFILQSADDFEIKWPEPKLLGLTSLVTIEGKQHTRLRNILVNAINKPAALRRIAQTVQPLIVASLKEWAEKGMINALLETQKVTLQNIYMMFVSMRPGPLLKELDRDFHGLLAGLRAYPLNFPGMAFHNALQCRRKLTAQFQAELEKKKKQIKSGRLQTNDLMDDLMQDKDDEGIQLTDAEVVDNIISFVVAGYASTALAIMWSLYHLSKSPVALQKLREENATIRKEMRGEFITMDDISKMKYTAKVVEETIRVANIAPFIFRAAKKDVEYKGRGRYKIPKGWQVLVWIRSIHTDPNNFDDPLCFNPERWNETPKPGTYQVFGVGSRICAGNNLVRVQLSIILHHLSLGYRWKLVNDEEKIDYLPHPKPVDGALMKFHAICDMNL